MLTSVSARLLHTVGYPQPDLATGQHWWVMRNEGGTLEDAVLCIVLASERLAPLHVRRCELHADARRYYAPGVEEMLQYLRTELKRDYSVCTTEDGEFYVEKQTGWFFNKDEAFGPNAADLLARVIVREKTLQMK